MRRTLRRAHLWRGILIHDTPAKAGEEEAPEETFHWGDWDSRTKVQKTRLLENVLSHLHSQQVQSLSGHTVEYRKQKCVRYQIEEPSQEVGWFVSEGNLFIHSFLFVYVFYVCVSLTMLLKEKLYWSRKQLFVCFVTQLKEPFPGYISVFSFVFKCRYMRGYH